jgi:hypothetical protein
MPDLLRLPHTRDELAEEPGDWGGSRRCAARYSEAVSLQLSTDLDDANAQPYFVWDVPITYAELRRKLQSRDAGERALWMARVMREARYQDVWKLLKLKDVLEMLPRIEKHLGRMREFWRWLIDGWRADGLL